MHSPTPFLWIYRQILQLPQLPVRPEPPPVFFGAATTCAGSVAVALYSACRINKQHEHIDIVCSYFSRTHSHILHTLVFSLTYRYMVAQLARRKPREPDVRVKGRMLFHPVADWNWCVRSLIICVTRYSICITVLQCPPAGSTPEISVALEHERTPTCGHFSLLSLGQE